MWLGHTSLYVWTLFWWFFGIVRRGNGWRKIRRATVISRGWEVWARLGNGGLSRVAGQGHLVEGRVSDGLWFGGRASDLWSPFSLSTFISLVSGESGQSQLDSPTNKTDITPKHFEFVSKSYSSESSICGSQIVPFGAQHETNSLNY